MLQGKPKSSGSSGTEESKAKVGEQLQSVPCIDTDSLLMLEYYLLTKFCPSGVYIVPHYEDHITSTDTVWDGVIFVKAGPYKHGKFWFFICFPEDYPKSWPRVQFHSLVYHPLVNPQDGSLDLRVPRWCCYVG